MPSYYLRLNADDERPSLGKGKVRVDEASGEAKPFFTCFLGNMKSVHTQEDVQHVQGLV